MTLGDVSIPWVQSIKYLGVVINHGKSLSFNTGQVKRSFFSACNCIYARAKDLNELVHLFLQESYCLPILTYASAVVKYTVRQEDELNACWNSVYRKLFGFNKWESVKSFICGLGRLDLHYIIKKHRMMFYWRLIHSTSNFLHDILWCYFGEHFLCDPELLVILNSKTSSINGIYEHFRNLCIWLYVYKHYACVLYCCDNDLFFCSVLPLCVINWSLATPS